MLVHRSALLAVPFVLFGSLLRVAPAEAQSIEHSVRIGLETVVFAHESLSVSEAGTVKTTSYGLAPSKLGVNLGKGVSDAVVVGGRFMLAGATSHASVDPITGNSSDSTELTFQLLPYVEYVFQPGQAVRPYVGATAGLVVGHTVVDATQVNLTGGIIGAILGFHGFVGREVSLDPELFVLYRAGSASSTDTGPSFSGFSIGLTLGISGWLGAREPEAKVEPTVVAFREREPTVAVPQPRAGDPALLVGRADLEGLQLLWLASRDDPEKVGLRFQRYLPRAALDGCDELMLSIEDEHRRYPLTHRVVPQSTVVLEIVQADIDAATLHAMHSATKVEFDLCGLHRRLNAAAALNQDSFVKRFDALVPVRPAAPAPSAQPTPPDGASAPVEVGPTSPDTGH